MPDETQDTALGDLRVIDLTTGSFGYAGKLLSGFGADVVKVEPPEGDPIRREPPFVGDEPGEERSGRHLHMNTGKQSVRLDLDTEEGRAALCRLASTADVLVESFGPGYLAERGLGYDDLVAEKPDLVMASISYFGQDGPWAGLEGSEIAATALGGYLMLTGDPDREPVKCYDNLIEQQTSLQAAVGIMVALTRRAETGEGDYLDVSAQDAALFLLGGPAQSYHANGNIVQRRGTRLLFDSPRVFYPSTIRPCKDGYVHAHTNVRNPDLMAVLMEDDRLKDPELMATPLGNADRIDVIMDEWLAKYDKFEVVRRAQEMRVPFTEVFTPAELVADTHLEERGFWVDVEHPVAGRLRQPGAPGMMTGTPWHTERAPLLGEHDALAETPQGE